MATTEQKNNTVDYLIVGQGIAGSALAISLLNDGKSIAVIDNATLSQSSKVAAGIWNPVVFKRLTKSWLADELIPELLEFYSALEKQLNANFLQLRNILKPFTEEQEIQLWKKKSVSENTLLDSTIHKELKINEHQIIASYSKVLNAGNLDMLSFMNAVREYVKNKSQITYLEETFDFNKLTLTQNEVQYKNQITAKNIVFCEGHLISQNPYFNWVPMKPAKGETLTISCSNINLNNDILNKGAFIMPLNNNTFKVGATYEWNDLSDNPTEIGKQELETKLQSIIKTPYTIISHNAGVRPAVIDRRPVIGAHPNHSNCLVFNGFGTKAVMLVPYFTKHFIGYLNKQHDLNAEVNVNRFTQK